MNSELLNKLNSKVIRLSDDIVTRQNSDGTVIIMKMEESDEFFKINGIAAHVFKELEAGKNLNDICQNILNEYNVNEEVVVKDIEILLEQLSKANILV